MKTPFFCLFNKQQLFFTMKNLPNFIGWGWNCFLHSLGRPFHKGNMRHLEEDTSIEMQDRVLTWFQQTKNNSLTPNILLVLAPLK